MRTGLLLVVAAGALGCERGARAPLPPDTTAASDGGGTKATTDGGDMPTRMRGHFVDGSELKDALVTGQVAVVNEVAARFVERHREQPFPDEWRPLVDPFMEWAQAAADAADFEAAAIAVANVSARCGECHEAEDVELELPTSAEPDSTAQMQRYRFAIDRMWDGLVAPDTERWRQGADVYARAVDCTPIGAGKSVPNHHAAPCNSIIATAGAAQSAETIQGRADAFAAVTFSCAGCHGADAPSSAP